MSIGDATDRPEEDAGFVSSWLQGNNAAQPKSGVVRAILAATVNGRLDESGLLKDLRALISPPAKEADT
jgi:hypothetical protein